MVMKDRETEAWVSLVVFQAVIALALFISAGTLSYWQAWTYLGVGAMTSVLLTLYTVKDPVLVENRMKAGPSAEQRPLQKILVLALTLVFIAAFIVPGMGRRLGWTSIPPWLCVVGDLLIVLSMWMVYRVFRENSFGSASVRITKDQKVISTGPYAIVRNPMYASAAVYFIGVSLALGSYWGFIPSLLMILGFVVRLFDEERFLAENLSGYTEYCAKVRFHLIPGIF